MRARDELYRAQPSRFWAPFADLRQLGAYALPRLGGRRPRRCGRGGSGAGQKRRPTPGSGSETPQPGVPQPAPPRTPRASRASRPARCAALSAGGSCITAHGSLRDWTPLPAPCRAGRHPRVPYRPDTLPLVRTEPPEAKRESAPSAVAAGRRPAQRGSAPSSACPHVVPCPPAPLPLAEGAQQWTGWPAACGQARFFPAHNLPSLAAAAQRAPGT